MKRYLHSFLLPLIVLFFSLYHFHFFGLTDKIVSLIKTGSLETKRSLTVLERRWQYKTKTGFSGKIEESQGSFYHLLGSWPDISIRDQNSAQASARKLLNGIKPFIKFNPTQFGNSTVQYFGPDGCIIKFPQYIQGYEVGNQEYIQGFGVETHPGITMHFMTDNPGVANVLINVVPDSVYSSAKLISREKADLINRELSGRTNSVGVKIKLIYRKFSPAWSSTPSLQSCEGSDPPAIYDWPLLPDRLFWRIDVPLYGTPQTFYIDAINGIQSEHVGYFYQYEMPTASETDNIRQKHIQETLTNKIIAETGFEGNVEYNRVTGELYSLEGKFPVHAVHNDDEAIAMAQSVLKKYAAYFKINLNQLKLNDDINRNWKHFVYNQELNGYAVEPYANVELWLPQKENEMFIYSSTFVPDIRIDTSSHLSQAEAMKIFSKAISQKNICLFHPTLLISCSYKSYNQFQPKPGKYYKLCWKIYYQHRYNGQTSLPNNMYIDAQTGKILGIRPTY